MGAIRSNTGKWYNFSDGETLYADDSGSSNLDIALQQNIADELDATFNLIVGNCVIGIDSFKVQPGSGNKVVTVTGGTAMINGQRCVIENSSNLTLTATTTHTIYLELDDAETSYDTATKSWVGKITSLTSTVPTGTYIVLATVEITGSIPVPSSAITDKRRVYETQTVIADNLNDNIVPENNARTVRRRLGMFASRIREIIGSNTVQNWKDPLPGAALNDAARVGNLTNIWGKFNGTTGHTHNGTLEDGAKINASNVNVTVTVAGNTSSTNVQNAIAQIHTIKLSRDGSQPMTGPLTLNADPTNPLHAATKQYVDQVNNVKQLVIATIGGGKTVSTTLSSMLSAPASITTRGGILKFEAGTGVWAAPVKNANYEWAPYVNFYLYRNSTMRQKQTVQIYAREQLGLTEDQPELNYIFIPVPVFYETPGSSTYTYDLKWDFSLPPHAYPALAWNVSTGRESAYSGFNWYILEM